MEGILAEFMKYQSWATHVPNINIYIWLFPHCYSVYTVYWNSLVDSFCVNVYVKLCLTLRIRANILPSRLRSMKKYILSSLFEKLRGTRDKTLVCKNRNRNVIAKQSPEQISRKQWNKKKIKYEQCLGYFGYISSNSTAVGNELRGVYLADFLCSDNFPN